MKPDDLRAAGGIRQDGQDEAHEAVGADLERDGRQHDGTAGRRLGMGVRQPRVHRPHRHLDGEGGEERDEDQHLRLHRQRQVVPVLQREAAGLLVEVDERDQHQQRAQQRVEEELDRGVDAVRATPDADDQVHRDQHRLEEHVEQDRVLRGERAVDESRHDQECRHVLRDAHRDDAPSRPDHEQRDERIEQDEQHRDAVDADVSSRCRSRESSRGARRTAAPRSSASKCVYSGIVTRKPASAPASAIQRAVVASRSRPTASTADAGDDRHPDGQGKIGRHGAGRLSAAPTRSAAQRAR